ncbi:hypothetical protein B0T20DRAFT_264213 [Sordaria brevicollis]|uniref:Uncharacterized protein n=1 Tax=Sordaria brevicollis TaxID=83679 RepID=A0AAE0UA41_SORBR|nr:hypothetical protein B0T20DRAFT_264213 [Sordaria brevicollis]
MNSTPRQFPTSRSNTHTYISNTTPRTNLSRPGFSPPNMLFKSSSAIISIFALCMVSHALGASIPPSTEPINSPINIYTARGPYLACNCPDNCEYRPGSTCKFYKDPLDVSSGVLKGRCGYHGKILYCDPQ